MSKSPLLLSVVVLLLAGVGAGVWLAFSDGEGVGESVGPGGGPSPADEPVSPDDPGDLVAREPDPTASEEEREIATVDGVSTTENFDLADAVWVEVHVAKPAGTPRDEELVVVALVREEPNLPEEPFEGEDFEDDEPWYDGDAPVVPDEYERDPGWSWSRRPVGTDNRARLPFPPGFERGWVQLDGRYLYLNRGVEVDLKTGTPTVELSPTLGAWLTGKLVLPPDAGERGIDASNVVATVTLAGHDMTSGDWSGDRDGHFEDWVELEGELEYEFGGLPTRTANRLEVEVQRLACAPNNTLQWEPGEHVVHDVVVTLGARVSGRVLDEGGEPIAGAEVSGFTSQGFETGWLPSEQDTDARGRFLFEGVPTGNLILTATKEHWIDGSLEGLEIVDGEDVEGLEIALRRGKTATGVVRWPDGRAAVGAEVVVHADEEDDPDEWHPYPTVGSDDTDSEGAFSIGGLNLESWSLRAELSPDPDDDAPAWKAYAEHVSESDGPVTLVLAAPLAIEGRVVDDLGAPVEEFMVYAERAELDGSDESESEDFLYTDGNFRFERVHAGAWSLSVWAVDHVPSAGQTVVVPYTGPPLLFRVERTGTIRGLVLDPTGAPAAGASVARTSSADAADIVFGGDEWEEEAYADDEGRFEMTELASGGHGLVAQHESWADSEPVPIELEIGAVVEDVVLRLGAGGTIVGHVYDENGDPWPDRSVSVGDDPFVAFWGGDTGAQHTDASGAFRFERITPGEWTVTAAPSQRDIMELAATGEEAMFDLMSSLLSERVVVVEGEETYVRLGAVPKVPVRVHGRVTEAGNPYAERSIYVVAEGGALMQGMKLATTDENGTYEVTVDRPGAYVFLVDAERAPIEFPTDVPETDELRLDLALPLGAIEGTVYGPDGKPATGIQISLSRGGGFSLSSIDGDDAETDEDGRYRFGYLTPGVYGVRYEGGVFWGEEETSPYGVALVEGVVVEPDDTTSGVDLHLVEPGTLEGIVRGPDGEPVAGAAVFVRDEAGRLLSPVSKTLTGPVGRFEHTAVAPGQYTLSARADALASGETDAVTVTRGQTTEAEIALEAGTELVVIVTDDDGEPVRVQLSVTDSGGREYADMATVLVAEEALTAGYSTKERRVGPLAPGRYTVLVRAADGREKKKRVTVKGKPETNVRIKLKD